MKLGKNIILWALGHSEEIGLIKVYGAYMLHNVIARAIQVHGVLGVTEDTPSERMYRHARFARILRRYANG